MYFSLCMQQSIPLLNFQHHIWTPAYFRPEFYKQFRSILSVNSAALFLAHVLVENPHL